MEGAGKKISSLLVCLLLAAPLAGESSTGRTRAAAATRVSVSIPALYGIRLLQEDADTGDPGGLVFASLSGGPPGRMKPRLAVLTTIGDGRVVLRRSVLEESPGEPALSPAARGRSEEGDPGSPAFFLFPSGAFGWKSLVDTAGTDRPVPASTGGKPRAVKVVYELWQF